MDRGILLITTPFRPNIGGVETHLDDLIDAGRDKGYKFVVLTYQPLVTKAKGKMVEQGNNYKIFRIPWLRMNLFLILEKYPFLEFIYLFPGLFILGFFYLLLNRSNISTIHAQGLVAGAIGVILSKLFNIPVIISTHSIYSFPTKSLYSKFVKLLFNNCKKVLTLSKQSQEEIIKLGVSKEKISVFRYWVDQKVFKTIKQSEARRILKISPESFICLFVGRLLEVKGLRELLEAVKLSRKDITYMIIGDGPMATEVKSEAQSTRNLMFKGKVENSKLPLYYNAANVLIVPSIHEEGFGRVILEALSCGLPVIASDRGGIKEALSKETGIFIDISASNIANAVENFFTSKDQVKLLASKTSDYASKNFSVNNAQMIFKHYE